MATSVYCTSIHPLTLVNKSLPPTDKPIDKLFIAICGNPLNILTHINMLVTLAEKTNGKVNLKEANLLESGCY